MSPPAGKVSLTQKYLPKDVWNYLQKSTSFGTNIYDCVKSGKPNHDITLFIHSFALYQVNLSLKLLKIQTVTVVYMHQVSNSAGGIYVFNVIKAFKNNFSFYRSRSL